MRDSIVLFEKPLKIGGKHIYGILYDKYEISPFRCSDGFFRYIVYIVGTSKFMEEGNKISDDGRDWTDTKTQITHYVKSPFVVDFCKNAVNGKTTIQVLETDKRIIYNKEEVDVEGTFIICPTLVDRYRTLVYENGKEVRL